MKPKQLLQLAQSTFVRIQPWLVDAVLLFTRITIGWSFFLTGKGKLANLERTTGFFESLGIPAPGLHAAFVGGVEMIGGLLLLCGLLSRVTAVPLAGTMVVAYLTAHREEAFASLDGFVGETPYAFLLAALVLIAFGPGRLALDHIRCKRACPAGKCDASTSKC